MGIDDKGGEVIQRCARSILRGEGKICKKHSKGEKEKWCKDMK